MKTSMFVRGYRLCTHIACTLCVILIPYCSQAVVPALAAGTQIQANVCSTTKLNLGPLPPDGTKTSATHLSIAGNAAPGLDVNITDNHSSKTVTINTFGGFATSITLQSGSNRITITASNVCGNSTSVKRNITRTKPLPLPPILIEILILLITVLILILLWLLLYKRRRQKKDEEEQNVPPYQQPPFPPSVS